MSLILGVGGLCALGILAIAAHAASAWCIGLEFDASYGYSQVGRDSDLDGLNDSIDVYGEIQGGNYGYVNVTLIDDLSGWPVAFNSTGRIYAQPILFGGTSYRVWVTVPWDLWHGGYTPYVTLANDTAECEAHTMVSDDLYPVGSYDFELWAAVTNATVEESESATYTLNVTSLSNNPDNATFAWYPEAGWSASASPNVLPLEPGANGSVEITVTAQHNAPPLHLNQMTIHVISSRNTAVSRTFTFNTTVAAKTFGVAAAATTSAGAAAPGGSLNLSVNATNLGNNRDNLSFALSSPPAGWSAVLSAPSAFVDSGANATITVTVTVPVSLTGAITWTVTLVATAGDGTTNVSVTMEASISLPDFAVTPSDIALSNSTPTDGDAVGVDVTVRNLGIPLALEVVVRLGDGTANLSQTVSVSVTGTGVARFAWTARMGATQLTVTVDATGAVPEAREDNNVASAAVTVRARNVPPSVGSLNATGSAQAGQAVTISAAGSSDSDGTVASYHFDFGDGNQSGWVTTPSVTHVYGAPGTYVVKVRVRDNSGAESSEATSTVAVSAAAAPPAGGDSSLLILVAVGLAAVGAVAALAVMRGKRKGPSPPQGP